MAKENIVITVEQLEEKMVEAFLSHETSDEIAIKKVTSNAHNKEKIILEALLSEDTLVAEDLSKVGFGHDKITISQRKKDDNDCLIGYHTLSNGMPYFGALAGAEWEKEVFFVLFWDGEDLHGYVPEKGNVYNSYTQEAFGNNEEEDLDWIKDNSSEDYEDEETFKFGMLKKSEIDYNWSQIERDLELNIEDIIQ